MKPSFSHYAGILFLLCYFAVTVAIGWLSRRARSTANSFLNATRSVSLPVVSLSYLAANCGALDILGLNAAAAQYGVQAFQFYWIGAIPAMIFLSLWVMPVYRRSGIRSVPEYFEQRYGPDVRLLNACVVAITRLLLGGINLYAMAQVLQAILGLPFLAGILLSAGVVLASILLGGIRATMYNSIFQLGLLLTGLVPLVLHYAKGRESLPFADGGMRVHLWTATPLSSTSSTLDAIGVVIGFCADAESVHGQNGPWSANGSGVVGIRKALLLDDRRAARTGRGGEYPRARQDGAVRPGVAAVDAHDVWPGDAGAGVDGSGGGPDVGFGGQYFGLLRAMDTGHLPHVDQD
jgi:hypothetical protein